MNENFEDQMRELDPAAGLEPLSADEKHSMAQGARNADPVVVPLRRRSNARWISAAAVAALALAIPLSQQAANQSTSPLLELSAANSVDGNRQTASGDMSATAGKIGLGGGGYAASIAYLGVDSLVAVGDLGAFPATATSYKLVPMSNAEQIADAMRKYFGLPAFKQTDYNGDGASLESTEQSDLAPYNYAQQLSYSTWPGSVWLNYSSPANDPWAPCQKYWAMSETTGKPVNVPEVAAGDDSVVTSDTPGQPTCTPANPGVRPSEDEAKTAAKSMFEAFGLDLAGYEWTFYTDDYTTTAQITKPMPMPLEGEAAAASVDSARSWSPMFWSVQFNSDLKPVYINGSPMELVAAGDVDLITPAQAIDRYNSVKQRQKDEAAKAQAEASADPSSGASTEGNPGSADASEPGLAPEPVPTNTEPVVGKVKGVSLVLAQFSGKDGTQFWVPTYQFTGDAGTDPVFPLWASMVAVVDSQIDVDALYPYAGFRAY